MLSAGSLTQRGFPLSVLPSVGCSSRLRRDSHWPDGHLISRKDELDVKSKDGAVTCATCRLCDFKEITRYACTSVSERGNTTHLPYVVNWLRLTVQFYMKVL